MITNAWSWGASFVSALGTDAETLYQEIIEANIALEDELKSYESSCEDYRMLLIDTQDALRNILQLTGKLNCEKINQSIRSLIQSINNYL